MRWGVMRWKYGRDLEPLNQKRSMQAHSSDMPQSYSPCSLSQTPRATKQRITHVTAVFSDEWNWSFSPRNMRSRRRRFPNSGETLSGFTATFCDDWKDNMDEEEDIDEYIWPSKREREEDMDLFTQHWDPSQPCYKRRRLESPAESLSFSAESPESLTCTATSPESQLSLYVTSPEPQICQFDEFESEEWQSSPGYLEQNVSSRLVDSNEEKFMLPGFGLSEDSLPNVPKLVQLLDLDIAALNKVDRDLYLALVLGESENSSIGVTNLDFKTKTSDGVLHSCTEATGERWSQNDGCEMGSEGFEFWDDFIKCCMGIHGSHDVKECQESDAAEIQVML